MTPFEVAQEVITDVQPNAAGHSNAEKWNYILHVLQVETLDIFTHFDFDVAYENAEGPPLQAAIFIAEMKCKVYQGMELNKIGTLTDIVMGYHNCLYWKLKMLDKLYAGMDNKEVTHPWIH